MAYQFVTVRSRNLLLQALNLVIAKYREFRPLEDIRSELAFVAENCDPDTDFVFMRP